MSHEYVELTHGAREVFVGATRIVSLPGDPRSGWTLTAANEHEWVKEMTPHYDGETMYSIGKLVAVVDNP